MRERKAGEKKMFPPLQSSVCILLPNLPCPHPIEPISSWKECHVPSTVKNLRSGRVSLLERLLVEVDSVYNLNWGGLAASCNSGSMDTSNEVFNARIVWFVQTRDQGSDSCANCTILMHPQFSGPKVTAALDLVESESSIDNPGYSIARWRKLSPNSLVQAYLSIG